VSINEIIRIILLQYNYTICKYFFNHLLKITTPSFFISKKTVDYSFILLNGIFDPFGFLSPRRSKAFLTDRTNGRAFATVLRPSSSSLRECTVYCGYRTKVVVYEKSIGTKLTFV